MNDKPPASPRTLSVAARACRIPALLYFPALAFLFLLFRLVGESIPALASLLYLPAGVWLAGGVAVSLPCLSRPRILATGLILSLAAYVYVAGWQWNFPRDCEGDVVRVATFNRGGSTITEVERILRNFSPELLALQEANGMEGELEEVAGDYHLAMEDEFAILSKRPVISAQTIYLERSDRRLPCAGRFEIDGSQGRFVVYNVHLPTPRHALSLVRREPGLLLPWGHPGRREFLSAHWSDQVSLARQLAEAIRSESLPVLAIGDFNAPPSGKIHSLVQLDGSLSDAHETAGGGRGYTFPADSTHPVFRYPWMRIDRILYSNHWRACDSRTLPLVDNGQHLPVMAELKAMY